MKVIISGYGSDIDSLSLFDLDLENYFVNIKDSLILNQASYVISYKEHNKTFVITYTKDPLKLVSYCINRCKFKKIDEIDVPYLSLTHLLYNKKEHILFGCSYKDGMYLKVNINDGYFSNLICRENDKPSLCHCVIGIDKYKEIGIIDIKNDIINIYDYDLNYKRSINLPKEVGPRHGIFHNNKLYVITEYSNEIYVIDYKKNRILQNISTLSFPVKSYGATLFILNDKLYASNRGEESIAVFNMDEKGLLKLDHAMPCYGNHPRHMILSKDNKYIISCNKNSNTVTVIDIESEKCVLTFDYFEPSGVANV